MKQPDKKRIVKSCILGAYVLLMLALWFVASHYLLDQHAIRLFVHRFGMLAPAVIFLVHVVFAVFVPIYTTPLQLAGGYLFGPWIGFLVNYAATVSGLLVIVLVSKRFGRRILEGVFDRKLLKKYDRFIASAKISPFALFIILVVPFFPDNEIVYVLALSSTRFKEYVPAILLGVIPKAALAFIGDAAIGGILPAVLAFAVTILVGTAFFHRRWIAGFFVDQRRR